MLVEDISPCYSTYTDLSKRWTWVFILGPQNLRYVCDLLVSVFYSPCPVNAGAIVSDKEMLHGSSMSLAATTIRIMAVNETQT